MAHAQKPDFVFRAKRTSPFKSAGLSVQSSAGSRGVRISGSNAGYITFRGSVKSTGYPLHSPVSPSLPLPCVTVCHQVSNVLYLRITRQSRPRWLCSIRHEMRPFVCGDCGFEYCRGHVCLSLVNVVRFPVDFSKTGRSLVQGNLTECVCACVRACVTACGQVRQ